MKSGQEFFFNAYNAEDESLLRGIIDNRIELSILDMTFLECC